MAYVRIADVITPEVYTAYSAKDTTVNADVFKSGIVAVDGAMSGLMTGGGRLFNHPSWGDLDNSEPDVGSDDAALLSTPSKLGSFKTQFVRQYLTKSWSAADLAKELAGADPMQRIQASTSRWWNRNFDRWTISTLNGVINSNIAQNAGDMVLDISAGIGAAANLSAGAILEAKQTMGDKAKELTTLVMHSRLYTNLQLLNLIVFIPNSQGVVNIPTYLGYEVMVTDNMPFAATKYTSYLCNKGILGWCESTPDIPTEVYRRPDQGNGTGVETLYTRRQFGLHPYGFNWTDTTVAAPAVFPTRANLELAANWSRPAAIERKHVPFVAIISKG
jgi:hypothetical protein